MHPSVTGGSPSYRTRPSAPLSEHRTATRPHGHVPVPPVLRTARYRATLHPVPPFCPGRRSQRSASPKLRPSACRPAGTGDRVRHQAGSEARHHVSTRPLYASTVSSKEPITKLIDIQGAYAQFPMGSGSAIQPHSRYNCAPVRCKAAVAAKKGVKLWTISRSRRPGASRQGLPPSRVRLPRTVSVRRAADRTARPVADGTRIGTGGNSGLPGGRAIRRGQGAYSMRARFEEAVRG